MLPGEHLTTAMASGIYTPTNALDRTAIFTLTAGVTIFSAGLVYGQAGVYTLSVKVTDDKDRSSAQSCTARVAETERGLLLPLMLKP
jgi:hypothetical protein